MPKNKPYKKQKNHPATVPLGTGLADKAKRSLLGRSSRIEQAINKASGVRTTTHKQKEGKK